MRKCKATTKDGQPCPNAAMGGGDYCFTHDPRQDFVDRRHAARARGGRRSGSGPRRKSVVPAGDMQDLVDDPVAFAKLLIIRQPDGNLGRISLSPRQESALEALAAGYKTVCLTWPKRSGKTWLCAISLIWKSLTPGSRSVCLANSREQAQALTYDVVQEILENTPALTGKAKVLRDQITFPWGSEIRVVPCNSRTVAGISVTGLLVSDEIWAAFSEIPLHILASQCEGPAAQTMLVSQASGRDKYLYELWRKSEETDDPSLYFDYLEPSELGVTPEEIAAANPNPFLTARYIASRQKALPTPLFNLYWLNEWGEVGSLLDGEQVEACFGDELQEFDSPIVWQKQLETWRLREHKYVELGAGLDRSMPQADRDSSVWTITARVTEEGNEESHFQVLRQTILPTGAEAEVLAEYNECRQIFGRFPSILESYQSADLVDKISGRDL